MRIEVEQGMKYIAIFIAALVALYTILFALENWRGKNHGGAIAIILLALVEFGLPFYMLVLR